MQNTQMSQLNTTLPSVLLPAAIHGRKRTINGILTVALAMIALAQFSHSEWLMGTVLTAAALMWAFRFWQLRGAVHVRLQHGLLQSYDPHAGGFNSMPAAEISSIHFLPASDRNLVKLPSRFIVRSNRIARELEVFVLAEEQQPKLAAFFQQHFPDRYQEPAGLPGFSVSTQ